MLTISSPAAMASPNPITIIAEEDFGSDWPFTQPEMHLTCLPDAAVVVMDVNTAAMYPLNGPARNQAKQLGMQPLNDIWRENPAIPGTRVTVGPVIRQGAELCE